MDARVVVAEWVGSGSESLLVTAFANSFSILSDSTIGSVWRKLGVGSVHSSLDGVPEFVSGVGSPGFCGVCPLRFAAGSACL